MDAITVEDGVETSVEIELEPCNQTVWNEYSSQIGALFTSYSMGEMLCPVPGSDLTMKGF